MWLNRNLFLTKLIKELCIESVKHLWWISFIINEQKSKENAHELLKTSFIQVMAKWTKSLFNHQIAKSFWNSSVDNKNNKSKYFMKNCLSCLLQFFLLQVYFKALMKWNEHIFPSKPLLRKELNYDIDVFFLNLLSRLYQIKKATKLFTQSIIPTNSCQFLLLLFCCYTCPLIMMK